MIEASVTVNIEELILLINEYLVILKDQSDTEIAELRDRQKSIKGFHFLMNWENVERAIERNASQFVRNNMALAQLGENAEVIFKAGIKIIEIDLHWHALMLKTCREHKKNKFLDALKGE